MAFQLRSPRLNLSFPLEFLSEGAITRGHCLNVSESGLLGVFDVAPELWTTGDLLLHFGQSRQRIRARVARVNENEAGLSFLFAGEREREAVRALVDFAAQHTLLTGLPPF